jgi:predicted alpha/beta-hydrolase family hydrolase
MEGCAVVAEAVELALGVLFARAAFAYVIQRRAASPPSAPDTIDSNNNATCNSINLNACQTEKQQCR